MLLELCGEPEEVAFGTVIATVSDINSRHSERNIYSKTSVSEFNSTLLFMPRRVARKFGAVRFCNVLVVSQELDKVFEHTSLVSLQSLLETISPWSIDLKTHFLKSFFEERVTKWSTACLLAPTSFFALSKFALPNFCYRLSQQRQWK